MYHRNNGEGLVKMATPCSFLIKLISQRALAAFSTESRLWKKNGQEIRTMITCTAWKITRKLVAFDQLNLSQ